MLLLEPSAYSEKNNPEAVDVDVWEPRSVHTSFPRTTHSDPAGSGTWIWPNTLPPSKANADSVPSKLANVNTVAVKAGDPLTISIIEIDPKGSSV